jgi:hypothetical protein
MIYLYLVNLLLIINCVLLRMSITKLEKDVENLTNSNKVVQKWRTRVIRKEMLK